MLFSFLGSVFSILLFFPLLLDGVDLDPHEFCRSVSVVRLVHPQPRQEVAVGQAEGDEEEESLVGRRDLGDIAPEESEEGGGALAVGLAPGILEGGVEVWLPGVFGRHGLDPQRSVLLDRIVQNTVEHHDCNFTFAKNSC
jgi:hypothetical protein